jgi:hypothetical protein
VGLYGDANAVKRTLIRFRIFQQREQIWGDLHGHITLLESYRARIRDSRNAMGHPVDASDLMLSGTLILVNLESSYDLIIAKGHWQNNVGSWPIGQS